MPLWSSSLDQYIKSGLPLYAWYFCADFEKEMPCCMQFQTAEQHCHPKLQNYEKGYPSEEKVITSSAAQNISSQYSVNSTAV